MDVTLTMLVLVLSIFSGPIAKEWRLVSYPENEPYCVYPSVFKFIPTPATRKDVVIL